MFLNNKYSIWYYNIINNSKNRLLNGYKEKHHIIPRCLGGKDTKDNLAILTAREHFIVHLLLCKFTTGQEKMKMLYAFNAMCNFKKSGRYTKVNSRLVDKIKSNFKFTKEHVEKIRLANLGKKRTEEQKQKLSQLKKGKIYTIEHIAKLRLINLGKKASAETKTKLREIQGNMIWVIKDNVSNKINKDLLQEYLDKGYKQGRNNSFMNKEYKNKLAKKMIGNQNTKGMVIINKNGTNKIVKPELVNGYLEQGYKLGRDRTYITEAYKKLQSDKRIAYVNKRKQANLATFG